MRLTRIAETAKRISISFCSLNMPIKRALTERDLDDQMPAVFTKIYPVICERTNNLVMSPLNLELMLVLMMRGGGARTVEEIANLLETRKTRDIVMESLDAMLAGKRMAREQINLQITNKIFFDKKYRIESLYKSLAKGAFFTEMEAVDFNEEPKQCLKDINDWVEKTYDGKFKHFTSAEIPRDAELVVVNLLYFTAKWKYPFHPERKVKLPFFVTSSNSKPVEMLNNTQYYGYCRLRTINARMLVMPYIGDSVSLVIIRPDDKEGLADVENNLASVNLMKKILTVRHPEVQVWIPRFKFECTLDLTDDLKAVGVEALFDRHDAHLWQKSKMKGDGLFVSRLLQKTMIDVNEENSTIHENLFMSPNGVSTAVKHAFKVDRPFIFCVVNTDFQTMLLIGRVKNIL